MMDPRKSRVISWDAPPLSEGTVPESWKIVQEMMTIASPQERCKFLKSKTTSVTKACNDYIDMNVMLYASDTDALNKQLAKFLTARQSHYSTKYAWYKQLVLNGEFMAQRLCLNPVVKANEKLYPLSRNLLCPGNYSSVNTRFSSIKLDQLLSMVGIDSLSKKKKDGNTINYAQLQKYRNIIGRWIRPKELAYMHESMGIDFTYYASVFVVPDNDAAIRKFTSDSIYDVTQKIKCLYIWVHNKNHYGPSIPKHKYIHVYTTHPVTLASASSFAPFMEAIRPITTSNLFKSTFVSCSPIDKKNMIKDERTIVDV